MRLITKKHLSRRTVLRGMGTALSLPLLDSMLPAQTPLAQTAANPQIKLGLCFIPHGAVIANWTPIGEGTDYEMSRTLAPIKPYRDQVVVVTRSRPQDGCSRRTWRQRRRSYTMLLPCT